MRTGGIVMKDGQVGREARDAEGTGGESDKKTRTEDAMGRPQGRRLGEISSSSANSLERCTANLLTYPVTTAA